MAFWRSGPENFMENDGVSEGPRPKRARATQACELCRVKKNKCDEMYPCSHCKSRNAKCVYRGIDLRRDRFYSNYVFQLEQQVKALSAAVSVPAMGPDLNDFQSPAINAEPPRENVEFYGSGCGSEMRGLGSEQFPQDHTSKEVSGINRHTRNVEFYGSSSSVVLLSRARKAGDVEDGLEGAEELVSSLHNPVFSPGAAMRNAAAHSDWSTPHGSATYYQQCRPFLDSFFTTLHYLQPMVDKPEFLAKCTALWTDGASAVTQSFVALYYSLMSLGALVGIREDEPVDGIENLEWSRIFFEEARSRTSVSMVTDIEMVQCYFFLAKICQNELNNHSAYMYGGLAVRTALAMGINREPQPNQKLDTALTKAASRTWWSLYSLETEMSFAMGRPDSLGADVYHNRRYPAIRDDPAYSGSPPELLEPPHCAMIKAMVDFARITKSVILGIYLAESTLQQALALARQIEQDLERWLEGLPAQIRPSTSEDEPRPLKRIKDPQYAKKQRLVLKIRYHNVRILLFGYFLTKLSTLDRVTAAGFQEELTKCLDSAKQTIETIYEACQRHDFFRTWFYNTMYILFATSIVLIYIPRESGKHELEYLYKLVEMAIEILEIMDESVVAMEAAKMIQGALTRTRCMIPLAPRDTAPGDTAPADTAAMEFQKTASWNTYAGLFDLTEGDLSGDLPFPLGDPSAMYPLGE